MVRSIRLVRCAAAMALVLVPGARANQPDAAAVDCLASVLRSASNAVSVIPADDWTIPGLADVSPTHTLLKGVSYTFRADDNTLTSVGVYLETEFTSRRLCGSDPNCVETAMGSTSVPWDNGRYQLVLRQPYPKDWYPLATKVERKNGWEWARHDSKQHPLYGLWSTLATKCRVDNLNLNPPSIDTP